MHELPLVIFTLFMQASVGCLVITLLCYFRLFGSTDSRTAMKWVRMPLTVSFLLGCAGLLGSMFHMGNPFHMFYTLLHVSDSWMSREVWATAIYMGLLFLSVALLLVKRTVNGFLLLLSAAAGLGYMYAMSALYVNTLFNLWGGLFTYGGFFGTVLLTGGMIAGLLLVTALGFAREDVLIRRVVKISLAAAVAGLLLMLIGALSLLGNIGEPIYAGMTPRAMPEGLLGMNILRVALIGIGLFFAGRVLCQKSAQVTNGTLLMTLAALCVFAGEAVGRVVFFSLGG